MQRVLVILAVILLVTVSLGVGALAAHWPFWSRAWQWHTAAGGWPASLSGPQLRLDGGGGVPLRFQPAANDLVEAAGRARTQLLIRVLGDSADAWFAPGFDALTPVDGRDLTRAVPALVLLRLEAGQPGLLDQPIGAWLPEWRQDQRGAITPRQLMSIRAADQTLAGSFNPLNPFSGAARLASGPDFRLAALQAFAVGPDAAKRTTAAARAQVLAAVAAAAAKMPFAQLLAQDLWPAIAMHEATVLLDRRRGEASAHCCLRASAADWLRLGLLLPNADGTPAAVAGEGRLLLADAGSRAALLWVGEGDAPSGLENLLALHTEIHMPPGVVPVQ